jgi:cytidylate kinase
LVAFASTGKAQALTFPAVSNLIVTLDGPSGTGKSTVSKEVARKAHLPHLDTGAYYRAATLAALRSDVDLDSPAEVVDAVERAEITEEDGGIYLDSEDVSDEIRGKAVTEHVSKVSAYPEVRSLLVQRQREWVRRHGGRAVVEGRDIGSVVFPDAELKIYLDADPVVRARRRARQMGQDPDAVIADLRRRDELDSSREASPLTVPDGAVVVDTSELTFDEVVVRILELVEAHS